MALRRKLTGIEGKATEHYFKHIFQLIPDNLRPDRRRAFKAYDGVNNIFNLAYEMLSWKVHRAIRFFNIFSGNQLQILLFARARAKNSVSLYAHTEEL